MLHFAANRRYIQMPERRKSRVVTAGNVKIGGNNHIPVQSMLNIPAEDAEGNVKQALELQKPVARLSVSRFPIKRR